MLLKQNSITLFLQSWKPNYTFNKRGINNIYYGNWDVLKEKYRLHTYF